MNLVLQVGLMIADSMKPPVAKCVDKLLQGYIYMIYIYIYGWVGGPTTCWRVLSTDVELSILAVTCQHISAAGGFMLSAIIRPSRALFWHHDHHSLVSTVGLAGFPLRFSYLRFTFACIYIYIYIYIYIWIVKIVSYYLYIPLYIKLPADTFVLSTVFKTQHREWHSDPTNYFWERSGVRRHLACLSPHNDSIGYFCHKQQYLPHSPTPCSRCRKSSACMALMKGNQCSRNMSGKR